MRTRAVDQGVRIITPQMVPYRFTGAIDGIIVRVFAITPAVQDDQGDGPVFNKVFGGFHNYYILMILRSFKGAPDLFSGSCNTGVYCLLIIRSGMNYSDFPKYFPVAYHNDIVGKRNPRCIRNPQNIIVLEYFL